MIINSTPYLFDFNEVIDLDTEVMEIFRKCTEIQEKFSELVLFFLVIRGL